MSAVLIGLLISATAIASGTTALKDYALGVPLQVFKQKPAPPSNWLGDTTKPTRIACSDDGIERIWLKAETNDWVKCSFEVQSSSGESSWSRSDLQLSDKTRATVSFEFFQGKLAVIDVFVDSIWAYEIEESLVQKFGKPFKVNAQQIQVRSGASFPQRQVIGNHGINQIVMTSPDLTLARMSVIYTDLVAETKAEAARKPNNVM